MAGRADPADPGHDAGQLLDGAAHHEALEAAQLRDLEEAVHDPAVVAEEDLHLAVALEARDRVDRDRPGHDRWLLWSVEAGTLKR
jgi:hypothetical protein